MREIFRRTMLAAAVAAAVSLSAGAVYAEKQGADNQKYERCDHKGHGWSDHGKATWKKTLTDEQKTELGKLHEALKKETAGVKDELRAKRDAARAAVAGDNPDREALGALTGEIAGLEKKLMDAKYGHMIKVRSILNAEQKAAFDASMKKGERKRR